MESQPILGLMSAQSFDNEEFLNRRDLIGCQLEAVGGGAHFAMGGVENKHRDLRDMVVRMCKDLGGCAVSTVLPKFNTAMNELKNVYGYSPAQLVFGFQPNLPHFPAQKHSSVEPGEEPTCNERWKCYTRQGRRT